MTVDSPVTLGILAIVGLWLAYFVPSALRRRQNMKDSRAEDRFSGELRVLAVCTQSSKEDGVASRSEPTSSSAILTPPLGMDTRPQRQDLQGGTMTSQASPARRAVYERRAAAARRRAILTFVLLCVTAVVVTLAVMKLVNPLFIALPAGCTATVLVLGRRAVVANQRADAAHEERERQRAYPAREMSPTERRLAGRPVPAVRTGQIERVREDVSTTVMSRVEASMFAKKHVTGRPVAHDVAQSRPSSQRPHMSQPASGSTAHVAASGSARSVTSAHSAPIPVVRQTQQAAPVTPPVRTSVQQAQVQPSASDTTWSAVSVPPPVYAAKAAAPRWEPPPISAELRQITQQRMEQIAHDSQARNRAIEDREQSEAAGETVDSLGVNLNSVLARRRAV
ncbi:hypothetical protein [Timonella sp. A28]|uniref:hypothetical protein n=1 Tax=Timonella sp. A28 TaxID=3442640 RepID=UPI003EB76337